MYNSSIRKATKIKRRRGACESCKERKLRCNGDRPCSTCKKAELHCEYQLSSRKKQDKITLSEFTSNPKYHQFSSIVESQQSHHGRNKRSIDSGIADCEYGLNNLAQISCSTADINPPIASLPLMSLNMLFQSRNVLETTSNKNFIPTDSMLHSFQTQLEQSEPIPKHISEAFKRLIAKLETLNSSPNPQNSDSAFSSEKQLLSPHVEAFFEHSHLASSFLTRDEILKILSSLKFDGKEIKTEEQALLWSVLSLSTLDEMNSRKYFGLASDLTWELISGPPSVTKVQVLVTMLLYTINHQPSDLNFLLLSNAINMSNSLNLFSAKTLDVLASSSNQRTCLKNLVWILWSIEKVLCLRHERLPLLRHDNIDFGPTSLLLEKSRGFCEYAQICSLILSFSKSGASGVVPAFAKPDLLSMLQDWRDTAKQSLGHDSNLLTIDSKPSLEISFQYHDAIFALLQPSISLFNSYQKTFEISTNDHLIFFESAREVLTLLGSPSNSLILRKNSFINISVIAWTIIFIGMVQGKGQASDYALLTITSGVFAQLSLSSEIDPGFHEISELGAFAISEYKNLELIGKNLDAILVGTDDLLLPLTHQEGTLPSTIEDSEKPRQEPFKEYLSQSWFLELDFAGEMWNCDPNLDVSWDMDSGYSLERHNQIAEEKEAQNGIEELPKPEHGT